MPIPVPDGWESRRFKRVARLAYGASLPFDLRSEGDIPVLGSNGVVGTHVVANTLSPAMVVGRKGSFGKVTYSEAPVFAIDTTYFVDQRYTDANIRWLYYATQLLGLDSYTEDSAVPGLAREFVYDRELPVPPLTQQRAIAAFLDRETAQIDALIAKKERLLALLDEKRTALITRAVTKGRDPAAPMKESGVEWLGEAPAHWQVVRLRHVLSGIEQGWSPDCENRIAEEDEWGVLKAGCANRGRFEQGEHKALPATLTPLPELEVRPGDVLMSRASGSEDLVGSVAYVGACRPRLLLSDKLFRLKPQTQRIDPQFLVAALNSRVARAQIEVEISGAGGLANNIGQPTVRNLFLGLPPVSEQHAIVARLGEANARFAELASHVGDAITLLREYRTALISAAVTGQIDVSGGVDTGWGDGYEGLKSQLGRGAS